MSALPSSLNEFLSSGLHPSFIFGNTDLEGGLRLYWKLDFKWKLLGIV